MSGNTSTDVRSKYEAIVKRRDESDSLAREAMSNQDYPLAFQHQQDFLREERKLGELLSENSNTDSPLLESNDLDDGHLSGSLALLSQYVDDWDD